MSVRYFQGTSAAKASNFFLSSRTYFSSRPMAYLSVMKSSTWSNSGRCIASRCFFGPNESRSFACSSSKICRSLCCATCLSFVCSGTSLILSRGIRPACHRLIPVQVYPKLIALALFVSCASAVALIGEDANQIEARHGKTIQVAAERGDAHNVSMKSTELA
jgi:hypothetical protein